MTIPILLLGLGLLLIIAEVLFPSMGILSVLAAASIIGAIVYAFAEDDSLGFTFLVVAALAVPITIVLGLRLFPRSPVGKHMMVAGLSFESTAATDARDLALEGRTGTVEAALHPAGIARIEGRRVDVVSRGEGIEIGARVRVIEVRGNRVVVARDEGADEDDEGS